MITLILLSPLLGSMIVGLFSSVIKDRHAQIITTSMVVLSALISIKVFAEFLLYRNQQEIILLEWFNSGMLSFNWSIKIDSLTSVMLVVVTSVSSLVHLYSVGYMSEDPHKPRFMSYLSLFTFFMLMLVTANNLIQLFLGWEGVGLCSYLLIGFWFKKTSANAAAMKAFIVNRVGDFAFIIGIFTIFTIFGEVEFSKIFAKISEHQNDVISVFGMNFDAINLICVLLFIGSMGKSAQIGLHTWLPDAMEGPTPVSALIHAATMVTAGVFLVARCSPLFEHAEIARNMVTIVGGITCIFAASIALTQNDIKKIIAYSTCSQLGYMFFACGVSAYSAGVFHLMTHAFFKALLFLGAGSVIHAMSHEQDIRKMGGIWRKIPQTHALMWIGSLALAGVFPFAGFFSKDIILEATYAANTKFSDFAFWCGICAAFLTSFYSWRLLILVFHGKSRASEEVLHHVHESPKSMMIPLYILAIGAVFAGFVGSGFFSMVSHEGNFFQDSISVASKPEILELAHHVPIFIKLLPLIVGLLGILLSYICYVWLPSLPGISAKCLKPFYLLSVNKFYVDEIYECIFVNPTKKLGKFLWNEIDIKIIDHHGPNASARFTVAFAKIVSRIQTGLLYNYAYIMVLGLLIIMTWFIF